MEVIDLNNTIPRYFGLLETMGYCKKKDVIGLLAYSFVTKEIFNGPLQEYLDDDGLKAINNMLRCFAKGSCLLRAPRSQIKLSKPKPWDARNIFRAIEDTDDFRFTESDDTRVVE